MLLNMAVKIALAVGLFSVICVIPGLKASQVVPDGLIYTEAKKTLVKGVQGVLTCRFFGDPSAVYWRKRLNPDELSIIVIWLDGEVSGPRYDDGSCDVDENYSLIIHNVSTADSGRIYCTVSNNKGPLMNNYTDILVVDTAITTNPQVTLQMRQATHGILQCTVHIKARRVSWKKRTSSSVNESLVVIENNKNIAKRSGAGYDDDTYNITQDYSLVIKEVQVHHEGLYVCEVTDDTGISFRNHTCVNVVVQPLEPFPTIQECLNTEQHDSNYCTLIAKSGMTLTCQAVKYYPSIKLVFLYGSKALEPSETKEWNNTDGTKNKTITIATRGNKELYICVASSVPGTNANESTSVLLQGDEPGKSTLTIVGPICSVFAALILISSGVYFFWKKKHLDNSAVQRGAPPQRLEVDYSAVPTSAPQLGLEVCDYGRKDLTQEEFKELEQHANDVVITHYRRIYDSIETESTIQAEKIINENRVALFDTHQMLIDWQQSQASTRKKETIDIENESDYDWPSDKELKMIARHLTQESLEKICKKPKIDCQCDDANDEEKRFETLREWRTNSVKSKTPLVEIWEQLFPVLESINLEGLLPILKRSYIYNAELVDLAFHLLIHDLLPFAKKLGINITKLASYRPAFHPSHLTMGTIKLLIERRDDFANCIEILELHYRTVAFTVRFEYDMSYGELCSISEAIHKNAQGRDDQDFGNLQDVLQLTDQDLADRIDTSHPLTSYELFKIWKEKPHLFVFNYRAALARELEINEMPDLANDILAGRYITERTSLAFIEDMVQGLDQVQKSSLWELLPLSGEREQFSQQIYDWVAGWTKDIKGSWRSHVFGKPRAKKHRDLNAKLVEHGFQELAREIMIIEQQLAQRL